MGEFEQPGIGMVVYIDQAWCDNFPSDIDGLVGSDIGYLPNLYNTVTLDAKISLIAGAFAAINKRTIFKE